MSTFEYVLAFVTLVLGLGLTKNLTAISELEFSARRALDLSDLVWLTSITLLQVDFWFVLWESSHAWEVWGLWQLLPPLAMAGGLFMAGAYFAQASAKEGDERWRSLKFGLFTMLIWHVVGGISAITMLGRGPSIALALPFISLILALFSRSRLVLFRIATFGYLAFSVFMLVFLGPTTIG